MKKSLIKFVVLSFVLGVVMPSANPIFSVDQPKNLVATKTSENKISESKITVVSLQPEVVINPASVALVPTAGCNPLNSTQTNFTQDTAQINLNEPANCFNLLTEIPVAAVKQLTVATEQVIHPEVVVISKGLAISSPLFKQGEEPSQIPLLPTAMISVFAGLVYSNRKVKKTLTKLTELTNNSLSIHQLGVMRC